MKALVYTAPEMLEFCDVDDPDVPQGSQLISIDSVGICGSDMHAFLGHDERRPAPLILGHEGAGTIARGPREGERVTVNPLVTCGVCRACRAGRDNLCSTRQIISMPPREGAFAQFVAMPPRNLVTIPDAMPFEQAALAEPIACGWHGVRLGLKALGATNDITALVIGGGPIGVGAALCLIAQGADNVTLVEPNDVRRRYLAADASYRVAAPDDVEDENFDLVVDGVGYEVTRKSASARARPGGVIVHIGLGGGEAGLDTRRMTLQEITFIGSYAYTAQDFRETAQAMFDGRLGPLNWVENRPLSGGPDAFADIRSGSVAAPKIILKP